MSAAHLQFTLTLLDVLAFRILLGTVKKQRDKTHTHSTAQVVARCIMPHLYQSIDRSTHW